MRERIAEIIEEHGPGKYRADMSDLPDAIIAAMPSMVAPLWQPISTAPKAKPVLIYDSGDVTVAVFQPSTSQWCGVVDGGLVGIPCKGKIQFFTIGKPTHWMPLPTPPEATP